MTLTLSRVTRIKPAVSGLIGPAVNHRMLQVDEHMRDRSRMVLVDQHRALLEQAVVALDD